MQSFKLPMASFSSFVILLMLFTHVIGRMPVAEANTKEPNTSNPLSTQIQWVHQAPADSSLVTSEAFPHQDWWTQFQDPNLTRLIQEALNQNLSLKQADLRIEESRGLARQALGQEFPTLSLKPGFNRQRNSETLTTPNLGQFAASGPRFFAPGQTVNIYTFPLQASYELDYLGKNRLKTKAAQKTLLSKTAERNATVVMVAGEVSSAYVNLLNADAQIDLAQKRKEAAQTLQSLSQAIQHEGLSSEDAVLEAKIQQADAESQLAQAKLTQALTLNQLAILSGKTPAQVQNMTRTPLNQLQWPQSVEAGVPSQLVLRRPDLMAAQAQFDATVMQSRVAKREMFPSFTVTGQFGFATTQLDKLFNWPSYLATVSPAIDWGLFHGGARLAHYRVAKTQSKLALAQYEEKLLKGFKEVEDSLANLKAHHGQWQLAQQRQVDAETLSRFQADRHQAGLVSQIPVLKSDLQTYQQQATQVQQNAQRWVDLIGVYKSVGGGF
jgi:NodT family efflux transporter outer membrane factor (OMF) lipoprotein